MKRVVSILAVLLLLIPALVFGAATVKFGWDGNTETDLAGYKLHQAMQQGGPYTQLGSDLPAANVDYTLTDVIDGTYYWVLTAFDTEGLESGNSNEVSLTIDTTAPGAPTNFIIITVIK